MPNGSVFFECHCGGTVPVPHNPLKHRAIRGMCSNGCGRWWEFIYDEHGQWINQPPRLVEES